MIGPFALFYGEALKIPINHWGAVVGVGKGYTGQSLGSNLGLLLHVVLV